MYFDFTKIPLSDIEISGPYSIRSKITGNVYLTSPEMMDKLFRLAGYESTKVIKALKDYAGKEVTEIDTLPDDYSIFVNNPACSFVVCTESFMEGITNLYAKLSPVYRCTDTYITRNEHVYKFNDDCTYLLYIEGVEELVHIIAIDTSLAVGVTGMIDEKYYNCNSESDIELIMGCITTEEDFSGFNKSALLSCREFMEDVYHKCKLTRRAKGKMYLTARGSVEYPAATDLIDDYNSKSWIERATTEPLGSRNFEDGCRVITNIRNKYPSTMLIDFLPYYNKNYKERSDTFLYTP